MTVYCGHCVERTVATHRVTASGGGPPISELVCGAHLDAVRDQALRRPYHSVVLVEDDRQEPLFEIGGGAG